MTRKREKPKDGKPADGYRQASQTVERSSWLGQTALSMGYGLFEREVKAGVRRAVGAGKFTFLDPVPAGQHPYCGVIVGHWMIAVPKEGKRTKGFVCLSKCGVAAFYEKWEVETFRLPLTCLGCRRGGREVAGISVIPEADAREIAGVFNDGDYMATQFEERFNLKGDRVLKEWADYGRPLLARVVGLTQFGKHFGWKVSVNDCSEKPNRSGKDFIRVYAVHLTMKHVEFRLRPNGCRYEYTCTLSTPRTDVEFKEIARLLQEAAGKIGPWAEVDQKAAPVAAAATPEPSANGHANGQANHIFDMAKLSAIYGSLGKLMAVGKDVNEVTGMKLMAQEKLTQAMDRTREREAACNQDENKLHEARIKARATRDAVNECEMKLANLKRQLALEDERVTELDSLVRVQRAAADAAFDEEKKVVGELEEVERMEKDQLAALGDAAGVKSLLEALSKL